jgi:hypothetical protein
MKWSPSSFSNRIYLNVRIGIVLVFLDRLVLAIVRHVVEVPLCKETAHERMSARERKVRLHDFVMGGVI